MWQVRSCLNVPHRGLGEGLVVAGVGLLGQLRGRSDGHGHGEVLDQEVDVRVRGAQPEGLEGKAELPGVDGVLWA